MICFANSENYNDIFSLWNECFPGEIEFRDWFFENVFDIEKTLIYRDNEKIAGMLQMFSFSSEIGDLTYIYGAGTSEKFRKQGIMQKLIEKSFEISKDLGHKYSFLIPASDDLFIYYEKFGFLPNLTTSQNEFFSAMSVDEFHFMKNEDLSTVLEIYDKFCYTKFKVNRDVKYFDLQLRLFGDGAVIYRENGQVFGYSFGYKTDDCYHISEIFSSDINKCLLMHGDQKIIYKTCGGDERIGAIRSLNAENVPFGYVNLLFN